MIVGQEYVRSTWKEKNDSELVQLIHVREIKLPS